MNKDILYILENLREEDKYELCLHSGKNWKKKTLDKLKMAQVIILKDRNEVPFAMGGIEGKNEVACVWLLTTQKVEENKLKLFKMIKSQLSLNSSRYSIYFNYICERNKLAKNWLVKLGFNFDNPKPKNLSVKKGFEFFYRVNKRKGK